MTEERCTHCGFSGLHSITCLTVAETSPNSMIDDEGDVFYADNPDDAQYFFDSYSARPTNPDAFYNLFPELSREVIGSWSPRHS